MPATEKKKFYLQTISFKKIVFDTFVSVLNEEKYFNIPCSQYSM